MSYEIQEVSLAYKSTRPITEQPTITCPEDAAKFLYEIWDDDLLELQEQFIVVLLDASKHILGYSVVSSGGSTATIVEPSAVFQLALLGKAQSIIVAHNHPSGNLKASSADISLTCRLKEAATFLGITLDDHLILTQGGYLSLREEGKI